MTSDAGEARHRALLAEGQAALNAGAFARVREICAEIFAFAPGSLNGLWLYLGSGRIAPGDAVFARIEAAARQPGLPAPAASALHFMLGKGYDDMGRPAEAFAAFVAANRLKGARHDPGATRRLAEATIAALARRPDIRLAAAPPRLVFVLGMPRSGTSLLAQMLGRHPAIANLGEQTALGAALAGGAGLPTPARLAALDAPGLAAARVSYLAAIGAANHPGKVLVDKMPENYWFAGLIPALFPDALIVHMRRERLAACWSCFRNDFREGHAYAADFGHLLAQYDTHLALAAAARPRAGANWHEVALDRLAAAPRATLAPLLAALGLPWHAACLSPEQGGAVATLSKFQVRQGIDPAQPGGWRTYLPFIRETWGVEA